MAAKFAVILATLLAVSAVRVRADDNLIPPASYLKVLQSVRTKVDLSSGLSDHDLQGTIETIGDLAAALDVHDLVKVLTRSRYEGERDKARHNLQVARSILEAADSPSAACLNDTNEVIQGLLNTEMWAVQMLDAAGKPDAGILRLQVKWLGSYSECLNISVALQPSNSSSLSQKPFQTKYCAARMPLGGGANMGPLGLALELGVCVPDSCTGPDLDNILSSLLHDIPLNQTKAFNFSGSVCQERELKLDAPAITAIVVASVIVALMVVGTLYDVIVIQSPRWVLQQPREDLPGLKTRLATSNNSDVMDERQSLLDGQKVINLEEVTEPGVCGRLLACFSVYTNGSKLLQPGQREGALAALNGVRFLSMSWVILGHTFIFGVFTIQNLADTTQYLKRWTFTAIANATVSVDSFFTISGLLTTYLVLKELKRNDGKLNWFMFFFHRYWRLTPPYMLLLLLYVPLFPYLGSGPQWPQQGVEPYNCTYWWRNLLYINNFFPVSENCMAWSWYLANDMQFYILSPLIFLPLFYSRVAGAVSVLVFLLVTTVTPGVISITKGFSAGLGELGAGTDSVFDDIYDKPYCRMGPYIVGMVTGYILYRTDCRVRLPAWAAVLGWAGAGATGLAVVYGMYGEISGTHPNSPSLDAFYNALNRTAWGLCVSWVLFACVTGHGGWVNTLLSWKAFVPLARLTYCAYLVHPILMYFYYLGADTPFYLADYNVVVAFLGLLVASYGVAFLLSLALEAPMMALEKVLLNRGKSS